MLKRLVTRPLTHRGVVNKSKRLFTSIRSNPTNISRSSFVRSSRPRQSSRIFRSTSTHTSHGPRTFRLGRWVLVAMAGGACYLALGGPRLHHPDAELIAPTVEGKVEESNDQIEFVHPYNDRGWFWRMYFKTKRTLYLAVLFAPCAALSLIAAVTDNQTIRQYWLDILVATFDLAGCSFQKFGQIITMRPDMFPADVCDALSKLRDQVPAHEYKHTRRMIVESFGHEIEEIFEEFDPVPVASGTVAQVHRARLKPEYASKADMLDTNGKAIRDVAVKVRHPHVLDETWFDIELIYSVVDNLPFAAHTLPFEKDEFLAQIQKQVNFEVEAHNLRQFASNFKSEVQNGKIWFPTVSPKLLSPSILVESWASGSALSEILSDVGDGYKLVSDKANQFGEEMMQKKQQLARTVFDMTIKMFLRDNLVHGDLHSGNVMYDQKGSCCTVIDAGLTTSIGSDIQVPFRQFLHAMSTGNAKELCDKIEQFNLSDKALDMTGLRKDIDWVCAKFVSPRGSFAPDGGPIDLGDLMGEVMFTLKRYHVILRGDVANSLMTLGVSEGLVRQLDPDFDVVSASLPYFVRYGVFDSLSVAAMPGAGSLWSSTDSVRDDDSLVYAFW